MKKNEIYRCGRLNATIVKTSKLKVWFLSDDNGKLSYHSMYKQSFSRLFNVYVGKTNTIKLMENFVMNGMV